MRPSVAVPRGLYGRRSGLRSGLPATIAGLVLWVDANVGITLNGSDVSQWDDQSGKGNHLTQGTEANQPAYDATGLNSLPTVEFDGVSEWMEAADSDSFDSAAGYTLFFVAEIDPVGANQTIIRNRPLGALGTEAGFVGLEIQNATPDRWRNTLIEDASGNYRFKTDTPTVPLTASTPQLITVTMDNSEADLFEDGVENTDFTWDNTSGTVGTVTSASTMRVGATHTPDRFFNGKLSELALYNRKISDAQRVALESFFLNKWGIS